MILPIFAWLSASLLLFAQGSAQLAAAPAAPAQAERPAAHASIHWHIKYPEAVAEAKQTGKPLFLFFTGSDWCGWCKKMQTEILQSTEFAKLAGQRFVFVDVDFPMHKQQTPEIISQNAELKQKYGITGFPTIVVLDPDQKYITEIGYVAGGPRPFLNELDKKMKR
jgi:protein disulfide-isomerase